MKNVDKKTNKVKKAHNGVINENLSLRYGPYGVLFGLVKHDILALSMFHSGGGNFSLFFFSLGAH